MSANTNKVIPAFREDLDCSPIYLGKDKAEGSYWFYALKAGTARFLKYINYFHWDRGPQAILEMSPIPTEIEQELLHFLQGQVEYEFAKKRSNSKEFSVLKHYRVPIELSNSDDAESSTEDISADTNIGRVGSGVAIAGSSTVESEKSSGRRSRRRLSEPVGISAKPAARARSTLLDEKTEDNKKPNTVENPPIESVSVTRKRFTVQGVLDLAENIESPAKLEQQNAKDGLELGHLGVLTPEVPKKRGRPKKA